MKFFILAVVYFSPAGQAPFITTGQLEFTTRVACERALALLDEENNRMVDRIAKSQTVNQLTPWREYSRCLER